LNYSVDVCGPNVKYPTSLTVYSGVRTKSTLQEGKVGLKPEGLSWGGVFGEVVSLYPPSRWPGSAVSSSTGAGASLHSQLASKFGAFSLKI